MVISVEENKGTGHTETMGMKERPGGEYFKRQSTQAEKKTYRPKGWRMVDDPGTEGRGGFCSQRGSWVSEASMQ